ncbi:MAG TPA: hypothetical protein VMG12_35480, partial [Polyangiaceae bacterium]|nr:hypothetical protein [Polyangiaceae bacterium]
MRRSAEHSIFALFAMAAASACAADDDPTYDPRAGDPEFDAPPALLGQWQERDAEGAVLAEQDYSTRGVVHIVNHSGGVGDAMWWYTVEGSTLTLDFRAGGQPTTHTFPYVV